MSSYTIAGVEFCEFGVSDENLIGFEDAWAHQRSLHAQVSSGALGPQVMFVQHPPVYTAGRRTEPGEMPFDGTPVVKVDRGGKITYHGPGQLVGYPIVALPQSVGIVDYVARLEEAIIRYLSTLGITAGPIPSRTGVWLPASQGRPDRKICAIGVRVTQRTSIHGFALNLDPDMSYFDNIVPCGISDAGVTSVARELGSAPSLAEAATAMAPILAELLAFEPFVPSPELTPSEEGLAT